MPTIKCSSTNKQIKFFGNGTDNVYTEVFSSNPNTISENAWNYIAVSQDGNNLKIYINGSIDRTATMINTFSWMQNVLANAIGAVYYDGASNAFPGIIDEFRISNTIRSATEIQSVWTAPGL